MPNLVVISIVLAIVIALVFFLIRKNNSDIKHDNPDAQDSVEKTMMEQERRKEKL
jgi:uncharacterized protein YneF (UPF0154 family)